jgi:YebC/PmpR family DNA-binding regulatory protein
MLKYDMSGHSKWANIKRQKNAQDKERAKIFSKLSKQITISVREGKSSDPEKNVQLRQAIERAKKEDMPKDNIKRAIENAVKQAETGKEIVLEGYGPYGLAVLIRAFTDNRQRTVQQVKNVFETNGGSLAEPGSVSYKFERQGRVVVENSDENMVLDLIDLGVDEINSINGKIEIFVKPEKMNDFINQIKNKYKIIKREIYLSANQKLHLDQNQKKTVQQFVEKLEELNDVEGVFTNE